MEPALNSRWRYVMSCLLRCRAVLGLALAALLMQSAGRAQKVEPAFVSISVMSLFQPHVLLLHMASRGEVTLDGESLDGTEWKVTASTAGLELRGNSRVLQGRRLVAGDTSVFMLEVPGKLRRSYQGGLDLQQDGLGRVRALVRMRTEDAVGAIVAAEAPPGAPGEALAAYAVAARSFLLANGSRGAHHAHFGFDACDTTHCQFLREVPPPQSAAAEAVRRTSDEVLLWRAPGESIPKLLPAMYSRSCGGMTRPRNRPGEYSFAAVRCDFCLRHPETWTRPTPAGAVPQTEAERIAYNRVHGWEALPSLGGKAGDGTLSGRGVGHGVGMCQVGAADLARRGWDHRRILQHFYPGAELGVLAPAPY